jgi:flagellin
MALSIHTNYSALVTQTNLSKTNAALGTNQQRLGTGFRINSAADDAAGLQIATRLSAQSRGMGVAMRNVNDATSMLQTAEGAFNEMTDIVQRMKDLATQGANGTNSGKDLIALQTEYDELGSELKNIMANTKFAGTALFGDATTPDGKLSDEVKFQIGASSTETLDMDVSTELTAVANALTAVSGTYDAATAKEQIADDADPDAATNANAGDTIDLLNTALDAIGSLRASLGANINRLGHTANNLANMKDNTDVATGTIRDANFALESANMSKNSMLMQSGISMLKQAGQMPGMVMSLLG